MTKSIDTEKGKEKKRILRSQREETHVVDKIKELKSFSTTVVIFTNLADRITALWDGDVGDPMLGVNFGDLL